MDSEIGGHGNGHPVFCKAIVTTDMDGHIASYYGVQTMNALTGFNFIGEQIGRLEADGRARGLHLWFFNGTTIWE